MRWAVSALSLGVHEIVGSGETDRPVAARDALGRPLAVLLHTTDRCPVLAVPLHDRPGLKPGDREDGAALLAGDVGPGEVGAIEQVDLGEIEIQYVVFVLDQRGAAEGALGRRQRHQTVEACLEAV